MGVMSFFSQIMMSDEIMQALPAAEQELYNSYPSWTYIAFAFAVFDGTLGSIGLLMKKKWTRIMFIISIIAIIPQMGYSILFANTMEVYGTGALIMPIMIVVGGIFLVWYAGYCIRRGWLN